MVMDLRLRTDAIITASDASEQGCGACKSTYLNKSGQKVLMSLKAHEELVNNAIGLIELYSGISGGRQALCLVGINPGVHVMSDVNQGVARA